MTNGFSWHMFPSAQEHAKTQPVKYTNGARTTRKRVMLVRAQFKVSTSCPDRSVVTVSSSSPRLLVVFVFRERLIAPPQHRLDALGQLRDVFAVHEEQTARKLKQLPFTALPRGEKWTSGREDLQMNADLVQPTVMRWWRQRYGTMMSVCWLRTAGKNGV